MSEPPPHRILIPEDSADSAAIMIREPRRAGVEVGLVGLVAHEPAPAPRDA
jgi:hypothetical protein